MGRYDIVEGIGDLAGEPGPLAGQPDGEIPDPDRLEHMQEGVEIGRGQHFPLLRPVL
jgi:hypothetical protein